MDKRLKDYYDGLFSPEEESEVQKWLALHGKDEFVSDSLRELFDGEEKCSGEQTLMYKRIVPEKKSIWRSSLMAACIAGHNEGVVVNCTNRGAVLGKKSSDGKCGPAWGCSYNKERDGFKSNFGYGYVGEHAEHKSDPHKAAPASVHSKFDPMTFAVLDKDCRKVWLVVVDGRQDWYSTGVKGYEVYRIAKKLGGWTSTRFDGGGSSCMWLYDNGSGKIVNSVSDSKGERSCLNYLLIKEK